MIRQDWGTKDEFCGSTAVASWLVTRRGKSVERRCRRVQLGPYIIATFLTSCRVFSQMVAVQCNNLSPFLKYVQVQIVLSLDLREPMRNFVIFRQVSFVNTFIAQLVNIVAFFRPCNLSYWIKIRETSLQYTRKCNLFEIRSRCFSLN